MLIKFTLLGSGVALDSIAVVLANSERIAISFANENQLCNKLKPDMKVVLIGQTNLTGDEQTMYYWDGDY